MKAPLDTRQKLGRIFTNVRWFQFALTLLTGKPLPEQTLPLGNALLSMAMATSALLLGVSCSFMGTTHGSPVIVILGWIASLHGMRYLQLVIVHNASHMNFVRNKILDHQVGFWTSALLMIQNFEHYMPLHALGHHRWQTLSTEADPTVQALAKAGIKAGNPVCVLMLNLLIALFSPRYHVEVFCARINSYYKEAGTLAKVVMSLILMTHVGILIAVEDALAWILAWVLPVTVMYQQAALLRLVVEHPWDQMPEARSKHIDTFPLTKAVFLGAAPPESGHPLAWAHWAVMMLASLLVRLIILPGDSGPAHDWHHQHPRGNWPNYMAARRKEAAQNPGDYQEIWGYWPALKACLKSISERR